jgi:signal transduction histidine kinase
MKQSAIQLAEHIDSVVTLARLEGDGELVHWREVDMTGFLRDLGNSIPGYWRKESVKLRWSADAGRNVRTDPDKLKFLLRHLIRNALKFTQHGEVAVSMSIAPGTLQFTIRDTGPGIPSEVKQGIVQMLDTSTPPGSPAPGGVGLGLYLACRMVRELWGEIRFDSEGGKGSSVHVVLPIEEAPRELALADEEPPPLLTADG